MKSAASAIPEPKPSMLDPHEEITLLREQVRAMEQRIKWFETQLFGVKSEKRVFDPAQMPLLGHEADLPSAPPAEETKTVTYQRGTAKKKRPDDCLTNSGLRFSDQVPVEVIQIRPPELSGPQADEYEIISTKINHRLAQRPASYVVLQYERPVLRHKSEAGKLITTPAPENVLERSLADVSLLVGLLVDKFLYHLPLFRQHQRMGEAGVTISRATLINLVKRAILLLIPIVDAQTANVLRSRVLAMDETPIKAGYQGRVGKKLGKMKSGYFWPLYGDADEVVFTYSASRGREHIEKTLREGFSGTLISDGYAAYASYARQNEAVTHAQCWVHGRRTFIEAEAAYPQQAEVALRYIAELYRIETDITKRQLDGPAIQALRLEKSKPLVDAFYEWCQHQLDTLVLTPKDPLRKALNYMLQRETSLRVFLEDPEVPMDTNHLERALRPIPMGRRSWLFCWTELGAEHVGIIQSLITTCRLHDVNPTTYLIDVLQRVSRHPAKDILELTPRVWKTKFADNPLRSDLYWTGNNVRE